MKGEKSRKVGLGADCYELVECQEYLDISRIGMFEITYLPPNCLRGVFKETGQNGIRQIGGLSLLASRFSLALAHLHNPRIQPRKRPSIYWPTMTFLVDGFTKMAPFWSVIIKAVNN